MPVEMNYNLFICTECNAKDCVKTFKGDYIHTQDEQFNPVMTCYNCRGIMQFSKQITSEEHDIIFRGKQPPQEPITEQPQLVD